jgi:hypothetical protein
MRKNPPENGCHSLSFPPALKVSKPIVELVELARDLRLKGLNDSIEIDSKITENRIHKANKSKERSE